MTSRNGLDGGGRGCGINTDEVLRYGPESGSGGGESIRKCLLVAAAIVVMVAVASSVSANAGNSKWGKGMLSESLFFSGESPTSGFMSWSPDTPEFVYDFHGYYLEEGAQYTLVCYEGDGEPDDFIDLGSSYPCDEYDGVHIKGVIAWPDYEDMATICLVPDTWTGFGGTEPATLTADELIDL